MVIANASDFDEINAMTDVTLGLASTCPLRPTPLTFTYNPASDHMRPPRQGAAGLGLRTAAGRKRDGWRIIV